MTERNLTDQARANIAKGATNGPGTDVCATCGKAKEPTRVNSRQCRPCAAGGGVTTADLIARLDKQAAAIKDLRTRVKVLEERRDA